MSRFTLLLAAGLVALLLPMQALAAAVEITAPAQTNYTAPASFTVTSTVQRVLDHERILSHKLYRNGALIAEGDSPTGELSSAQSGLEAGTYWFHSVITTNYGETLHSVAIAVTVVVPGGNPPVVAMNPVEGGPYIAPATITLSASAADSDGYITRVDFMANGAAIGSATAAPFQMTWSSVPVGAHQVSATATDNNGISVTSTAVGVTVGQSAVIGNVDSITLAGSEYRLNGWACSTGRNAPIDVHLYLGGAAGAGDYAGAVTANLASDPVVAAACQSTGTAHRFAFPITSAMRQQHANKSIYVHGISPIGAADLAIGGSGVLTIPPPLGLTRSYVYDQHQQLCKTIEPETGATVMRYDAAGNLVLSASGMNLPSTNDCDTTEALASPRAVLRDYDSRNRIKTLSFPDGNGSQVWNYMVTGLPQEIVTYNDDGTTTVVNTYQYNKRGLPTGESSTQPGWYSWGIGYGYDPNGSLATQSYPSGLVVDFAPNALGQPTRAGAWATGVSYYPNGAIQQFTYGNGVSHSMAQNARQLPERGIDLGVIDFTFRYDENANTTRIDDVNQVAGHYSGSRDMQYDALDRLTYANLHWWQINNFRYDALDNIRSKSHASGSSTVNHSYWYDASNRLTNVTNDGGSSATGLGYDVQGNLQNRNGQDHKFDFGNRLREVTGKEAYRYDGHGRRVLARAGSQGSILSQYSQAGQVLFQEDHRKPGVDAQEHIYLAGSLVATRHRNYASGAITTRYQHTDALGSPVAMTDEAGQVVDRTNYEPYGAAIGKVMQGVGYTGHVMDAATGLTYMQQRFYDPAIERFLSVDPVTANGSTGANFNRYWYANNNPYRFTDPDGRLGCAATRIELNCRSGAGAAMAQAATTANAGRMGSSMTGPRLGLPLPVPTPNVGTTLAAGVEAISNAIEQREQQRVYVTYTLTKSGYPQDVKYYGRASGFGTPQEVMMSRFSTHERRLLGYGNPELDKSAVGPSGRLAIRGREQQRIDAGGGIGSHAVGNFIRAVSPINPMGPVYNNASNEAFGPIAPYTGW